MKARHIIRAIVSLGVGFAAPIVDVAWKCRAGHEATEACVWGRSYLPLGRVIVPMIVAPLVFVGLYIVERFLNMRGRH